MDESEDELSGAHILLTDQEGPVEEKQSSEKRSVKECCFSCCRRVWVRKDKISR